MAPIPGWVYIITGIAISVFSKFVESKTEPGNLALFFYIGILFIAIGLLKYVFKVVFKKKQDKPAHEVRKPGKHDLHHIHKEQHNQIQPSPHHKLSHLQGQHEVHRATQHPQHLSIIGCPSCGTKHYNYAKYCMRCGTNMKEH